MWPLISHDNPRPTGHSGEVVAIIGSSQDRETVSDYALTSGWELEMLETIDQVLSLAGSQTVALIIVDRDHSEHDWRASVQRLAKARSNPCVLLASSVVDPYLFQELVKQGGFDVIAKPIHRNELARLGRLALTYWRNQHTSTVSG